MSNIRHNNLRARCLIATSCLAILGSTHALADDGQIEEVVVTARKHSENLLQTPVAVTALSEKAIQEQGIQNINDVAAFTPSVFISNNSTGRNDRSYQLLVIRGMPPSNILNPTAQVFVNGAPLTSGFVDGIDDAARVEVLKGPQSAYFGRNTFAGAVNVVTKTPSDTFAGSVDGLVGSGDWTDWRIALEGPIIPDKLLMRVSGRAMTKDGTYANSAMPGQTQGDQSTQSGNFTLYATPTDRLKIKAFGMIWHDDDGPGAQQQISGSEFNCYPGTNGVSRYYCGTLPAYVPGLVGLNTKVTPNIQSFLINNSTGKFATPFGPEEAINHFGLQRDAYHWDFAIDYELPEIGATLSTLTAGNKEQRSELEDLDVRDTSAIPNPTYTPTNGSEPFVQYSALIEVKSDDISQEIRLTSDIDQPFRWTVGANYVWSKFLSSPSTLGPTGVSPSAFTPTETNTEAGFVALAYDIMPDLTINFEGRYQLDRVTSYNWQPRFKLVSQLFHSFIPRTILQYKIDPDTMVFATYSEGVSPGQFNGNLLTTTNSISAALKQYIYQNYGTDSAIVQPETIKNYELGYKAKLWDGRATLTVGAYYDQWSNQIIAQNVQLPNVVPLQTATISTNIGESTLKGLEIEGKVAPTAHITINGSFAWNDTRIDKGNCVACAQIEGITNSAISGTHLPNVPEYTAAMGIQYADELEAMSGYNWYVRGDWTFHSGVYDLAANIAETPNFNMFNLRGGIRNDTTGFEVFIDNVADTRTFDSLNQQSNLTAPPYNGYAIIGGLPDGRRIGVRAHYYF